MTLADLKEYVRNQTRYDPLVERNVRYYADQFLHVQAIRLGTPRPSVHFNARGIYNQILDPLVRQVPMQPNPSRPAS
jgi:hypothetical protein